MPKNKTLHILFASRLVQEKGVEILIDTIKKSQEENRDIVWHITSTGTYEQSIRELVWEYPSRVLYHGKVSQVGLATLYRQADFLYMPSLFLETFGLTALESLACGTSVIGFSQGGLIPFISKDLSLVKKDPVGSFFTIIDNFSSFSGGSHDVESYNSLFWKEKLSEFFPGDVSLYLIHDYHELIGGAEYYVSQVVSALASKGNNTERYGYRGSTSAWKRRLLFISSMFSFWRYFQIKKILSSKKPGAIWMHSVLRYIGFWGLLAISNYSRESNTRLFLSHHDVGLLAPFPQDITDESELPKNAGFLAFLEHVGYKKKGIATVKWYYISLIKKVLPDKMEHIIFAPFLERHVEAHFPKHRIHIFPHSYDERIFYP